MTKSKILEKDRLKDFIDELSKENEVLAPIKTNNYFQFKELSQGEEISLDYQNTKQPPKEVFLPQTEVLFTYRTDEEEIKIKASPSQKEKRVILGIRPCDARALVLLDRFFSSGDYKDNLYLEKRENTAIIGLACNSPLSTCFCLPLGGSPFGGEGLDLLLKDINDKYLIETITNQGEKLIKKVKWLKDATKEDEEKAKTKKEDAENALKNAFTVKGLKNKLDSMFEAPLWDQIHRKCVGCGVCSFLCPTCTCFDVLDEMTPSGGRRVRIWDTCQFPLFTKEASGFNPRPSSKERMRQRIMHKFNYFPKDFEVFSCVGCGRCIQACPVNLDIREVITTIMAN